MDVNLKVKFESPEVISALLAIADALAERKPAGEDEQTAPGEEKEVTIEEVRAVLAKLSEAGKRKEVRELLKKFGAGKLTDVAPQCYGELLKEAGEL